MVVDATATESPACPSSTPVYDGYRLVVTDVQDVTGASLLPTTDYIYVSNFGELRSNVVDASKVGIYTVTFTAGLK